ncbi:MULTISPECIES: helix-turn-helix domain-containing protein [Spirosoma]|uniref:AraC family transcriptional regulator n=1 Tax=Spirosoma liriopis TaxID=2937440 RepID=A0ABT0HJE9_9BACT|nr:MULTISPECIES: AraC family transcriptional regulator [Spirosoma]MCK8492267.1 AraC family transcriptional regulator [Spirosoma liriopis]UHG91681.1 AraC family transcriptional regulator [Spirosoma oryzicola]
MKALFEKVPFAGQSSLLVRRFKMPYFDAPWHYHPEYELTYIVEGYGRRFVGDHIEPFTAGDLVLIGPDLPHFWRSDEDFYQPGSTQEVESIVIQFPSEFSQQGLTTLPEASAIQRLLERSRYGLRFSPAAGLAVRTQLNQLPERTGFLQLLGLLEILDELAADSEAALLASDGYQLAPGAAETERMKRVLDFMLTNFREEIRVEQIASVAGMAPAAFCRYFKKRTRKSFVEYLNELRIGHARKLLTQVDISIGQVGLECGFNNSSHFHRQFKLHTGMTPLHYQTVQKAK